MRRAALAIVCTLACKVDAAPPSVATTVPDRPNATPAPAIDEVTGTATRSAVTHGSPTRSALVEHVAFDDEPGAVERGCFLDTIVLVDDTAGETRLEIAEACDQTISIFADWASVGAITWVDTHGPLGPIAVVEATHGGRGDEAGITHDAATTLHVFAVKDGVWLHGALPVAASIVSDCQNDFCDDPDSKDDDDQQLRKAFRHAWRLSWRVEGGVLTSSVESREGLVQPPDTQARTIASWATQI